MTPLERLINDEIKWRETEIAITKIAMVREYENDTRFQCLYRCFVAITYAHYEGFLKKIFAQAYLDIKNSPKRASDLRAESQNAIFGKALRKHLDNSSTENLIKITSTGKCIDLLDYPSEDSIMGISNLNQANLEYLLSIASMDWSAFSSYRTHVFKLVDLRHRCAHGEKITFDRTKTNKDIATDIFSTQIEISNLMQDIALSLMDVMATDGFCAKREPEFLIA